MGFLGRSQSSTLKQLYDTVFYEGYIGVTFFFILSGFILSYSYSEKMKENNISKTEFFISRFSRIYPLHFLTFLLSLPLFLTLKNGGSFLYLLPNISLTQSFFPKEWIYFSANTPSWSLSNEIFFYILFPFLIFKRNMILLSASCFILAFQVYISVSGLPLKQLHYWIYIFPVSRLLDFIIGILLFRLFTCRKIKSIQINPDKIQVISIVLLVSFFL